jgi:hypothetical protein
MATIDRIRDAMHAQPFRPFDIKLVDGKHYTVKHPDYIAVPPGNHPREVTFYAEGIQAEDYETHWINLGLIVEVIVPSAPAASPAGPKAEGNGASPP